MVSKSQIIIEFQCFGSILQCRSTKCYHLIHILLANGETQKLQASRNVFGIDLKHLMKHRNGFLVHLLGQQILSCQHSDVRIFLFSFEHGIKQTGYLDTILVGLFRTKDELTHDVHLSIALHPVVQQYRVQLSLIQTVFSLLLVISSHRQHGRSISRFFFQHLLEDGIRLFFLSVVHINISQDSEIAHIVWIFFRKILDFGKRLFVVVHRQIHAELLHTDSLRLSITFLQAVQCIDYLLIVFGTVIKVHQRHQWFQSFWEMTYHVFINIDCFCRLPFILIISSKCLIIPIIIRVGRHCLLQSPFTLVRLIEKHIKFSYLI